MVTSLQAAFDNEAKGCQSPLAGSRIKCGGRIVDNSDSTKFEKAHGISRTRFVGSSSKRRGITGDDLKSRKKIVTPFSYGACNEASPFEVHSPKEKKSIQRPKRSSRLTAKQSTQISVSILSPTNHSDLSSREAASYESTGKEFRDKTIPKIVNAEIISEYDSSPYFPVMFHRMLNAISEVECGFMRWTNSGSGFIIDYSHDEEKMSEIIKSYFKRKHYLLDYCS